MEILEFYYNETGEHQVEIHALPHYSTDTTVAWEVVEKIRSLGMDISISTRKDGTYIDCGITNYDDINVTSYTLGNFLDAPHSICLAALKAVEKL